MTPAARVQAAIECLDQILEGAPAEQVMTRWARNSRYAGSKDRAAVRDHVFDALRSRRTLAALGGGSDGRAIMLGAVRASGDDPAAIFGAGGHGPAPLDQDQAGSGRAPVAGAEAADFPDWLWPEMIRTHGDRAEVVARALTHRAPVHLRVNMARVQPEEAISALAGDGIQAVAQGGAVGALDVTDGARKIRQSRAYLDGLVGLQDAASQAVIAALALQPGMRVLDYCAGGGGKALAMAAHAGVEVFAHDIASARLVELEKRAKRAETPVAVLAVDDLDAEAPFDVVLCDVPCSGSGAWRRSPDAKWRLTPERLHELGEIQSEILERASGLVSGRGMLVYATCSVLGCENGDVITEFQSRVPGWHVAFQKAWDLSDGTDGFFTTQLLRG